MGYLEALHCNLDKSEYLTINTVEAYPMFTWLQRCALGNEAKGGTWKVGGVVGQHFQFVIRWSGCSREIPK